jgi:hypothetical protein
VCAFDSHAGHLPQAYEKDKILPRGRSIGGWELIVVRLGCLAREAQEHVVSQHTLLQTGSIVQPTSNTTNPNLESAIQITLSVYKYKMF